MESKLNFEELKTICTIPGAPGFENPIRKHVIELVAPHVGEVMVDNLGNLITIKKGVNNPDGKKVMLAAHLDEISFMVKHIDDKGFLRIHPLGGFDPKTLTAMRVWVHGKKSLPGVMGSKPIHIMTPEERKKMPEVKDFYVDLGLPKEEVEQFIEVGNPVTRYQELIKMGHCINGKSLDNRLSVYILLEVLRKLENPPFDVYGVFTVQEEVGIRGANVAAHRINPDYGLAIDVTLANDVPGSQAQDYITKMGDGAAIKLYDGSTICDERMVRFLKETAKGNGIKWQTEILTAGGTDTAGIQRMGKHGAIAGAVSIPLRYVHQTTETAAISDVEDCISLITKAMESIDGFDWGF